MSQISPIMSNSRRSLMVMAANRTIPSHQQQRGLVLSSLPPCHPQSQPNTVTTASGTGNRVCRVRFFVNGDRHFAGITYVINADRLRTLDTLCKELSRILVDVKSLPSGVRIIFNCEDGTKMTSIHQFVANGNYVCASGEHFSRLDYPTIPPLMAGNPENSHRQQLMNDRFMLSIHSQQNNGNNGGLSSVLLNGGGGGTAMTKPLKQVATNANNGGVGNGNHHQVTTKSSSRTSNRRRTMPVAAAASSASSSSTATTAATREQRRQSPSLATNSCCSLMVTLRPKLVALLRGQCRAEPTMRPSRRVFRFLLNHRVAQNYEQLLNEISKCVKLNVGAVHRVYGLSSSKKITCLEDFFDDEGVYMVYGRSEKCNANDFLLDDYEQREIAAIVGWSYLHSYYGDKTVQTISRPNGRKSVRYCLEDSSDDINNNSTANNNLNKTNGNYRSGVKRNGGVTRRKKPGEKDAKAYSLPRNFHVSCDDILINSCGSSEDDDDDDEDDKENHDSLMVQSMGSVTPMNGSVQRNHPTCTPTDANDNDSNLRRFQKYRPAAAAVTAQSRRMFSPQPRATKRRNHSSSSSSVDHLSKDLDSSNQEFSSNSSLVHSSSASSSKPLTSDEQHSSLTTTVTSTTTTSTSTPGGASSVSCSEDFSFASVENPEAATTFFPVDQKQPYSYQDYTSHNIENEDDSNSDSSSSSSSSSLSSLSCVVRGKNIDSGSSAVAGNKCNTTTTSSSISGSSKTSSSAVAGGKKTTPIRNGNRRPTAVATATIDPDRTPRHTPKHSANKKKPAVVTNAKKIQEPPKPKKLQQPSDSTSTVTGSGGDGDQKKFVPKKEVAELYYVDKTIGDGKFGVVYTCIHRESRKSYAMKVVDKYTMQQVLPSFCDGAGCDINSEVSILSRVQHPNIVRLYDHFDYVDQCYLVLELLQGGDLFDAITVASRYSEPEAAVMITDLLKALNYLHNHGIVHRDIKLENLLVAYVPMPRDPGAPPQAPRQYRQIIKLADFGLAVQLKSAKEKLFTVCGTPTYVAPEILLEIGYLYPVDIWAAGVIAFILLSGLPPFVNEENDQDRLFDQIISGKFEFAGYQWRMVSDSAKRLIRSMLCVEQTERITADQALNHPWIVHFNTNSNNNANSL